MMQGPDSNTSVSPGTDLSTATKHRHASFSDFLLTIPFGIVNAAAGIVTLFLKARLLPLSCIAVCHEDERTV